MHNLYYDNHFWKNQHFGTQEIYVILFIESGSLEQIANIPSIYMVKYVINWCDIIEISMAFSCKLVTEESIITIQLIDNNNWILSYYITFAYQTRPQASGRITMEKNETMILFTLKRFKITNFENKWWQNNWRVNWLKT